MPRFSKLSSLVLRDLESCLNYEITNLLWALSQFHKSRSHMASTLHPGRVSSKKWLRPYEQLLDAVLLRWRLEGLKDLKLQVLISALVSVAPWREGPESPFKNRINQNKNK